MNKFKNKKFKIGIGILLAIILVGGIVWAVEAGTQTIGSTTPWTTSASAGTVDDADYAITGLNGPYAYVKSTSGVVDIRYNVVALPGLEGGQGPRMTVRFRDTGHTDRVLVWLKEYNVNTGASITRMTFDSNNFAASSLYQTKSVSMCSWPWKYDFNNKVYYIETSITKDATVFFSNPGLASVQLGWTIC